MDRIRATQEFSAHAPKSICSCGHSGDGANSDHADYFQAGHGACTRCLCAKFSWKTFTNVFAQFIKGEG